MELENVKAKLAKLMALYEGAKAINSEGEANAAAAAIQRLCLQYNLSLADVSKDKARREDMSEQVMSCFRYKSIGGHWEFRLMWVVARWNLCEAFTYGGTASKRMIVFGKKENIELVCWLYDLLCERFVKIGKEKYKVFKFTPYYEENPIGLDTYLRRYLVGCCEGLNKKFAEEKERAEQEEKEFAEKVTALTVSAHDQIIEYVENKYTANSGRKQKVVADMAYSQGTHDGYNAEIQKAIK
nr:MAG TPA: Protein of unknown function (DUF2786) [Caudoviricetes sp.]